MNIAVIGCGYWGKNVIKSFYNLKSLYAICEIDQHKLKETAAEYPDAKTFASVDELLNDSNIHGIAIITPTNTHYDLAKKTLESGYHTYVEKPLTSNSSDSNMLANISGKSDKILMVGDLLEYHPAFIKIKEIITEGGIGQIRHIRSSRINMGGIKHGENIIWSFAPQDVSIILSLINKDPVEIRASSFRPMVEGVYDTVYSDLIFAEGQTAHIHVSWLEPIRLHQKVIITDKAMLVFNDTLKENKLIQYNYNYDKKVHLLNRESEIPIYYDNIDPVESACKHFLDCIKNNAVPITNVNKACKTISLLECINDKLI